MTNRPPDECPYHRPFPPGFRDCPAYRWTQLRPLDSRYRPLRAERTCQHLDVGTTATAGRFYARCAVGSHEERVRWADPERERQLGVASALTTVMEQRLGELTELLWAAKARQLRALDSPDDSSGAAAATAELERLARRYMVDVEALLEDEIAKLQELNLPLDTLMELFREIFTRWIPQRSTETPAIPDELVERFPEQAWWLLRPRSPR
jgi:hypothetical protein